MAQLTVDELEATIRDTGRKLGMPNDNVDTAIGKCADRLELRALCSKWQARHRTISTRTLKGIDSAELDAYTAAAEIRHEERLGHEFAHRQAERARLTLGARLDKAMTNLAAMSTVPAVRPQLVRVTGSEDRPAGPPAAPTVDITPLTRGLAYLVEQVELVLDAERGLVRPADVHKLPGEVKDRIILTQLVGMRADAIAEAMPWLGRQRKIEIVRRENGQRPVDGTPAPVKAVAA